MSTATDYCAHGMHVNAFHCVGCAEDHEAAKVAAQTANASKEI